MHRSARVNAGKVANPAQYSQSSKPTLRMMRDLVYRRTIKVVVASKIMVAWSATLLPVRVAGLSQSDVIPGGGGRTPQYALTWMSGECDTGLLLDNIVCCYMPLNVKVIRKLIAC